MLTDRLDLSERRACSITGQPRSTQRYEPRVEEDERRLVARLHELVRQHPRYGYRRMAALLRGEGFRANDKRVYRLWKQEGFKVPKKSVRKRRLGDSTNGVARLSAKAPNEVWAWDFFHDRLADGRPVKWLGCIDEYTRECLLLEPRRSIKAKDAAAMLGRVIAERGAPKHLRSDNGPEFIAEALREFLKESNVETLYIEPGSPWQNGFAESFNARVRDELIGVELFTSMKEAEVVGGDWREAYNARRPHSSLGYLTPAAFAATQCLPKTSEGEACPAPRQTPPLRSNLGTNRHPETLIAGGA
jgi:transposase InsO family protein